MIEPIFKTVLGKDWDKLGSIVKNHYSLTPQSEDYVRVDGVMDTVHHSTIAKLLIPFGMVFGAIVPYRAKNVPIEVHYSSRAENSNLYWHRVFYFKSGKDFHFKSYMKHVHGNEVVEYVRFGMGIRLVITVEDGALVFRGKHYVWNLFGITVPVPGRFLLGEAYVEERPIDDDSFSMKLEINHGLFGNLFNYSGVFSITKQTIS